MTFSATWLQYWADTDRASFDILEILIDKGLLALLIAFAGLVFSLILERSKSTLTKEAELAKITTPLLLKIIEESESLYKAGLQAIADLDAQMPSYAKWAEAICESRAYIDESLNYSLTPTAAEILSATVVYSDGTRLPFIDFVIGAAPDAITKEALQLSDFATDNSLFEFENGGFLATVFSYLRSNDNHRVYMKTVVTFSILSSLFVKLVTMPRKQYSSELNAMRRLIVGYVPLDNRRERKAFRAIIKLIEIAQDTVNKYPKGYLARLPDSRLESIDTMLFKIHGGFITQIRMVIRAL
jgi:hypothetical protein